MEDSLQQNARRTKECENLLRTLLLVLPNGQIKWPTLQLLRVLQRDAVDAKLVAVNNVIANYSDIILQHQPQKTVYRGRPAAPAAIAYPQQYSSPPRAAIYRGRPAELDLPPPPTLLTAAERYDVPAYDAPAYTATTDAPTLHPQPPTAPLREPVFKRRRVAVAATPSTIELQPAPPSLVARDKHEHAQVAAPTFAAAAELAPQDSAVAQEDVYALWAQGGVEQDGYVSYKTRVDSSRFVELDEVAMRFKTPAIPTKELLQEYLSQIDEVEIDEDEEEFKTLVEKIIRQYPAYQTLSLQKQTERDSTAPNAAPSSKRKAHDTDFADADGEATLFIESSATSFVALPVSQTADGKNPFAKTGGRA